MGLQQAQGMPAHDGEQFDIRATIEGFKHSVNIYGLWKPGMEIQVSHVKRRNIPLFVFPGGVRPSRTIVKGSSSDRKTISRAKNSTSSPMGESPITGGDGDVCSGDEGRKRK